tara:strand:+ start:192 stop:383 length:192 start_codon:yes stop_codon:yes gene_type:complete
MDHKERINQKAHARLARMNPNSGHARNLRARLGLSDTPAPAPVVEEAKPKASKKKTSKKKSKS